MKKVKPFIIPVLFLTFIDQVIKVIISNRYMQYDFEIIAHLLRFNSTLNTNLSWAGNFIDVLSNSFITVLLNIVIIFVFISGYSLYGTKRTQTSFSVKMIMICGLAGCLCSLIDKLYWGGSLDFLQISNLFVFDVKDCYLTVAEIIFIIVGIFYNKEISVKEYFHYCFTQLKHLM